MQIVTYATGSLALFIASVWATLAFVVSFCLSASLSNVSPSALDSSVPSCELKRFTVIEINLIRT